MIDRVHSVIVGKDISRTASLVILATYGVADNVADGEVFVCDKNKSLLPAGSTISDSEVIYIGVGLPGEVTYNDAAGNSLTTRKLRWSPAINGKRIKSYVGVPYTARVQQSISFVNTGLAPTAGTEYIVRVIYKDMVEHPGQFTHTYRYIATSSDASSVDVFFANLAAKINAHKGRRVEASVNATTDTLTLTAKAIPESTTSLNNIDEDRPVLFDAFIDYVSSTGRWVSYGATKTVTPMTYGSGNWYQVRDREKNALGYLGVLNRTKFPVKKPDFSTVVDETYNTIIIEFDSDIKAANDRYTTASQTVEIFIPDNASGNQMSDILAVLNPWMESAGKQSISF